VRHSPCCTLFLINCLGIEMMLCDLYLMRFDLTKGLLFESFFVTRRNMGKIFLNDYSTFPSTLRRADLVNHTCSRGHFAHGHLFRDVPFKCWEIQIHARFRLLLPEAHPQPLSSLLEFTILRYFFFESHQISTWQAGGGHVSGRSMTVTVVCETVRT